MKFLPTTIEGWNAKKRLFMRLWSKESDPEQAEVYEHAINYCDRKVGQVHKVSKMFVIVLAYLILMFSGCAKVMQGTGLIFEGVGDGVVAGGQHLQESASK